MSAVPITLIPPSFPDPACFSSFQEEWNFGISNTQATVDVSLLNGFNLGNTEPGPDNRDKPWFRTFVDGSPDRWYVYFSGNWVARHERSPGDRIILPAAVNPGNIATYDGGDANPSGVASGPMWAIDSVFTGRSPMGVGAIPTSNPAKTLTAEEDFGEGAHTLTVAELAAHHHSVVIPQENVTGENPSFGNILADSAPNTTTKITNDAGGDSAHPNIHPIHAVYFGVRTSRLFYKV